MATEQPHELVTGLEQARRPVERCPLPSAGLHTRFATSLWVRRLLPTAIMVRRAEARGRALWTRSPEERARARAAMEAVVDGTPRAHEIEALAREHLVEGKVREALFWQPWTVPALEQASAERLREALSSGRGVLLSSCHIGPYLLGVSVISARGGTPYSVAGGWLFETPTPGYWGRRVARRRAQARARDERLICAVDSFAVLKTLLAEGEVVSVFFAIPGHRETHFLGKPVMLASGSARLATQTDALILPIRTRRSGHRVWVDVDAPLDPRDFAGAEELHDALAAAHERLILELPATIEDPNREGAWELGASARMWIRPEPSKAASS
jgi:lauroyl/myristoyl acyltransferase